MQEMQAGQQYLVTNIKFTKAGYETVTAGYQRIDEFKIPAVLDDMHGWLDEYDHTCSDKIALAIYVRTLLFYNFEMTYDFQHIKDLPVSNDFVITIPAVPDIVDHKYTEYTTATVDITIPTAYIATLSADDIEFGNDIEQALFENMLRQLQIDLNVLSLTDKVLELMTVYMHEKDASAPNSISEAVYELVAELTGQVDTDKTIVVEDYDLAERVSTGVFELSSALVKDMCKYW
jgi:hypothetical protein